MNHFRFPARRLLVAGLLLSAACASPNDPRPAGPAAVAGAHPVRDIALSAADPSASLPTAVAATSFFDLPYASRSPMERLDLYLPSTGKGPFPVVLWIHGGGWQSGDKALAPNATQLALVNNGIAVASVNYRLSHQALFPAQIQDVKAAVRWLRANATTYKLDTARVGAWGSSAGGHLATLLGTSNGVAALTDPTLGSPTRSERVKAVVDFFGPISFRAMDTQLRQLGCPPAGGTGYAAPSSPPSRLLGAPINTVPVKVATADPISYITAGDAAVFIQHGSADCTVPYPQSVALRAQLQQKLGMGSVTYQLLPGLGHGDPRFLAVSNVAKVVAFFKANL